MTLLKIGLNVLFIKWGCAALKTYKPIVQEIEREQTVGVPHQAKAESNSKIVQAHKKKVFKIVFASFIVMTISILYARSYFMTVVDQFVEDEYAAYYSGGNQTNGNNSYPVHPTPNFEDTNSSNTDPISPLLPNSSVASYSLIAVSTSRQMGAPLHLSHKLRSKAHQLLQEFHQGGDLPAYRNKDGTPFVDVDIENWDFQNISCDDAKLMAGAFISSMAVGIFAYFTFLYAIFCCIINCVLNRTYRLAQFHENCQEAFRHSQIPAIQTTSFREQQAPSGLGFERVPLTDPNEDSIRNYSPNGVIARTTVSIN